MTKVIINNNRNRIAVAQTNNIVANVKFSKIATVVGGGGSGNSTAAYNQANAAYAQANLAYADANVAIIIAEDAYAEANSAGAGGAANALLAYAQANAAYAEANISYIVATNAYSTANAAGSGAGANALLAYNQANSAYGQANVALTDAELAYNQANAAYAQANSGTAAANAYAQANAAYSQANIATTDAIAAYGQANQALTDALNAYFQANTAYDAANAASANALFSYGQANAAYTEANLAYSLAATKGNGDANLTVSDSPPANARANLDFWWQSNTGVLKIFYNDASGGQWVDASPPYTANGGAGEPIGLLAYAQANAAYNVANLAYAEANSGGSGANTFTTVNFANANIGGIGLITSSVTTTSVNGTAVTLDSFAAGQYTVVKYLVQVTTASGIQATEVLCMQDGIDVYSTEYGTLISNQQLGVFSANLNAGNFNFSFTPYNPTLAINHIKVIREAITS